MQRLSSSTNSHASQHPLKDPERCPHCNSRRLIRKGTRKKKLESVPLWRCKSCGRTFTLGPRPIPNKTYPVSEILEAITLFDRGYTLAETAEKISSRFGRRASPRQYRGGFPSTHGSPHTRGSAHALSSRSNRRKPSERSSSITARCTSLPTTEQSSASSGMGHLMPSAHFRRAPPYVLAHSRIFSNRYLKRARMISFCATMALEARRLDPIFSFLIILS